MKPDLSEIGKIVRDMTPKNGTPGYNAAAAEIVKQGIDDKQKARYNYEPMLTKPSPKKTL
jgi:hypothetical protein